MRLERDSSAAGQSLDAEDAVCVCPILQVDLAVAIWGAGCVLHMLDSCLGLPSVHVHMSLGRH
jgi:hypothetical protein